MIQAFIENYKELGIVGVFAIMMTWYLWHQTRMQSKREDKHDLVEKDERLFYRNLVTNDMREIHKDNAKNAELNIQTITLQKDMAKQLEKHNGHSKKAWEKTIESLGVICDKLNGGK